MNREGRNGKQYLYSREGKVVKSLGPRSEETEKTYAAFKEGNKFNADRLETLDEEVTRQAAVLSALNARCLPFIAG